MANATRTPRIVITMMGGIILDITSDVEIDIHIFNFDIEGWYPEDYSTKIGNADCVWVTPAVTVNDAHVNRLLEEAMHNKETEGD